METLRLNLKKLQDQRGILNHQLCNQLGIDGEIIPSLTTDTSQKGEGSEMSWQNVALTTAPSIQKAEKLSGIPALRTFLPVVERCLFWQPAADGWCYGIYS